MKYIAYTSARSPSPLRKAAAIVTAAAMAAVAVMFSAALLAMLLLLFLLGSAWLWWKTRAIRKQMRDFPTPEAANDGGPFRERTPREEAFRGEIIEGEAVRVRDPRDDRR